ncbi:MAG: aminotransferase class V-fold PLP-dependent enzyme [Rickettsiales bacterium]|nr:aminotransferase class V-fold PLP-dependent enzyme [Rickettsiales bacterium]
MTNGNKIIYIDSAASALKSESVIAAQTEFLRDGYANAGRGVCSRANAVDNALEAARASVANFIGAKAHQIIFTSGATDGLNRLANMLPPDSVVAVSDIDHHSARLPFAKKCKTILCELDDNFDYKNLPECDAAVITAMSNVLGSENRIPRDPNKIIIVDAAALAPHKQIDVKKMGCDALVFSAHKIGADTGLGVLYLREPDKWISDRVGGGQFNGMGPAAFEAGTLPLTQIMGLPAALKENTDEMRKYVQDLTNVLYQELEQMPRIKLISSRGSSIISFYVDGMNVFDVGALLGANGVCVRVGNMCASFLHQRLGISGSVRLSLGAWNTIDEVKIVVQIIKKILQL